MATMLEMPGPEGLREAVDALRAWQDDAAPMQLHPGDLGWFWRSGAEATAAAVRTWRRDGRILAVGLLDGPRLLRLTTAPDARRDEELARRLVEDATEPERGVLPAGRVNVEAPAGALVRDLLAEEGWGLDEPWTPLRRDLTDPVEDPVEAPNVQTGERTGPRNGVRNGLRIEVAGPERAHEVAAVHRAGFEGSTFTEERWHAMAAGLPYTEARCLIAYDDRDDRHDAVATVTVWSAGPGRPGLLEPMSVHRDHRRRGHGRTMSLAAAATLRSLGSSSVLVCTPSANVAAVAAYTSAGFRPRPEIRDRCRS
ncbi:GNAT family N-acetyltransferase [Streptomyces sp. NPDC006339]|uniref:GNAT family N-acetyltransferase n=1 Tax=Streptomyces sp. NPDC006339 TaxID=3156755 RepID=UPI0033A71D0C